ncbi:PEP-CTERM sorting domain-containing protein [Novosphingobium album (ex Hu et al. 2023)]|uniref:PEP-CTERM sorting domain-containing protein n=1 Tax=Novosphingobium album (ex Hu et al. 2023) TaxID=2930093 RepID=A0ABT0B5A0_9SPHN|nr:PEP-CTERM sorting domain-containing protein [Novosphingobium album (ex Hu et al. 2023)]MCJ2180061.1 PEP-CTERM sorting domain-containing protein [Novosphingobium album (ex Hu et al. 2023)]
MSLTSENRRRRIILSIMVGSMLTASAAVSNVRALFAPGDLAAAIQEQQLGGSAFAAFAGDPLVGGGRRLAPAARFIRGGNALPGEGAGGTDANLAPGLVGPQGGPGLPIGSSPQAGLPGSGAPNGAGSGNPGGTSGGNPGTSGGQAPSEGGELSPPFTPAQPTPTPTEPLPEPETWAIMLVGIGFSGWVARRSKRRATPA